MPDRSSPPAERSSAAELGALLEAAVDAIIMIDEDGRIMRFNTAAERLFGYTEDEIRGRPIELLMPEPYRSEHGGYLRRYLDGGEPHIIGIGREVEALKANGDVFPVSLSVGEARHDRRHFVGIVRDLSEIHAAERERHALEARLAHVGRFSLMGEMAAGIAHEINQPLAAIANYSQAAKRMLAAGRLDAAQLEKACSGIAEQVHRAGQVIENLRSFIRKQDVRKELIDLNDVIRDAMGLVRSDTNAAGILVRTRFELDLPKLQGNTVQLQQVLLNLTRNAVDAMQQALHKDKGILIETRRNADGRVQFAVTDHGGGISKTLDEAIFHPFVTTKGEGLGVGLAISKTIVQAHGGELVFANNPGGGATFTVSLPAQ